MSYYGDAQWSGPAGQAGWEHQTPPARSGASSAVPREESAAAFAAQIEEVDKAIDNLVKSGKMFGMPPNRGPRMGPNAGPRAHHAMSDHGDSRGGHPSNLQNFYASQRHQSSRGSNEAEQMIQAKRRMAAQRERELRNYHQEQQFNRTVLAEISAANYTSTAKPDRALSPGNMSEEDRRELIARQRSALYGEGPFAETGGYVDETGTPRPGLPTHHHSGTGPASSLRGHSPLAYEYGRTPPAEGGPGEAPSGSQSAGQNQRSRANSTASPQSNTAAGKGGVFDAPAAQQSSRTSNSSPGGSPGTKVGPGGNAVAPIGTRPSGTPTNPQGGSAPNPALNKRSTTPLHSPLSHGFSGPGAIETTTAATTGASNPPSAAPDSGINHPWGTRPGVWGNGKSGLSGVQASVWG